MSQENEADRRSSHACADGPRTWREIAADTAHPGGPPLLVVHGNCQAESLRVLCASALGDEVRSVRVPPVFELEGDAVDAFHALLRRTDYLVTQPIVDDYRGYPLGTAQVTASLPPGARVARVPVLRWAALTPTQAIVRAPGVGDPPVVPYHDLRVLASAARGDSVADLTPPASTSVRAVRDITREHLRVRQQHHGTVDALGVLHAAGADATWTLNHPQNGVLRGVAEQVLSALGEARTVPDPGRVLLSTTTAPVTSATLDALGLAPSATTPRDGWTHAGRTHTEEEVAAAHLAWYAQHPQVVDAGLRRHADTLDALGATV